jgi:hypothetical protein
VAEANAHKTKAKARFLRFSYRLVESDAAQSRRAKESEVANGTASAAYYTA